MSSFEETILDELNSHQDMIDRVILNNQVSINSIAKVVVKTLKAGNKIILFGNGGSFSDANHIASEFVGRLQKNRKALSAIALGCNGSTLSALSNDFGFDMVFARELEAIGKKGDLAFGITTSGRSKNVINGLNYAKKIGMQVCAFCGEDVSSLDSLCDEVLQIPSKNTQRIQEMHILVGHIIAKIAEDELCS